MCGLLQLFQNLLNFAFTITVPIAVIVLVYGGFRIMTAAGSPEGMKAGRDAVVTALIGVAIVFGAWIVINTILNIVGLSLGGLGGASIMPWTGLSC